MQESFGVGIESSDVTLTEKRQLHCTRRVRVRSDEKKGKINGEGGVESGLSA